MILHGRSKVALPRRFLAGPLAGGILFVTLVLAPLDSFPFGQTVVALGTSASAATLLGLLHHQRSDGISPRALWVAVGTLLALTGMLLSPYRYAGSYPKLSGVLYLVAALASLVLLARSSPRVGPAWWQPRFTGVGAVAFVLASLLLLLAFWYVRSDF
jgi:hypothetical protein